MIPSALILEKASKARPLKAVREHVSLKSNLISCWNSSRESLMPLNRRKNLYLTLRHEMGKTHNRSADNSGGKISNKHY